MAIDICISANFSPETDAKMESFCVHLTFITTLLVTRHNWPIEVTAAATAGSIKKAAEKGHLALLQWAKENAESYYNTWPKSKMFPAAAKCDNVELYQWLFDQKFPFEEENSFARSHCSIFWNDEF